METGRRLFSVHSAPREPRPRVFVVLYAASGAAALVYEVTWTRLLTLQLGHTVAAASTVLAAFMGGLARSAPWLAGAAFGPARRRFAPTPRSRSSSPSARCCCRSRCAATVPALAWAYADGTAPARFALVRVAISLALLGSRRPRWARPFRSRPHWYRAQRRRDYRPVLYATNTAGAALGAIAAGFFLIPAIGLRGDDLGRCAAELDRRRRRLVARVTYSQETAEPAEIAESFSLKKQEKQNRFCASPRVSAVSAVFSDVAPAPVLACSPRRSPASPRSLYEVAWTRLLALVIGPTTYAFATMAAAFISGLAIGSALGSRLARRVDAPGRVAGRHADRRPRSRPAAPRGYAATACRWSSRRRWPIRRPPSRTWS